MQTAELIARSHAGDKAATAALVEDNTGLIWAVARRFFGRGVEPDDLFQLGSIGFLKAVSGYDPAFGTQFSTYAVPKIAGEIRRFLRDDGAVKVSRTLKERAVKIARARAELVEELGREPTLSELSEALGLEPEQIAEAETALAAVDSTRNTVKSPSYAGRSPRGSMMPNLPLTRSFLRLCTWQNSMVVGPVQRGSSRRSSAASCSIIGIIFGSPVSG